MPAIRQLACVPRELEEEFPGKFHLHKLWAIVRSWENSSSGKTRPCRIPYSRLGIELAFHMGRPTKPYSDHVIGKYLGILRSSGWIKTIQICHVPTERFEIARQKYAKKHKRTGPPGNRQNCNVFVNYAIVSSGAEFPIIKVKFAVSAGEQNEAIRGMSNDWGHPAGGTLNVFININTTNNGERCSPVLLSSKERRGILNMRGFFEVDTPQSKSLSEECVSDAKNLHNALVAAGLLRGQRVSQKKWAAQLNTTRRVFEEYPEVFDWVIKSLMEKGHIVRTMIHSPTSLHKKFVRLLEIKQRDEKRPTFELPDDDHTELITQIEEYIESAVPGLKTQQKDLRYALWELCDMAVTMSEILEKKANRTSGKISDLLMQVSNDICNPKKWLDKIKEQLENLQKWNKWSGRLSRTKLGWGIQSPKAHELLCYVVEKASHNDLAVKYRVLKIIKGVFEEIAE